MITIPSVSVQYLVATIEADQDPTGTAPTFLVVSARDDDPTSFVAGEWSTTWDSVTHKVTARTATVGAASADLPLVADVPYLVLMELASGVILDLGYVMAETADPQAVIAA